MREVRPIQCLAIVNRGEAAMRCIRTVKSLRAAEGSDMRVVALYTDVDRLAPFVRHADRAVRLPVARTAVAAYLDHDLLIATLQDIGADAVWPGWGFVAENASFVDRLTEHGIRFLGPTGDTMRALGDKIASKLLAEQSKVPVTPWSGGPVADVAEAERWAQKIGFPLVVKASAGGGGRGIRVVRDPAALEAAFVSAASEARTAFGDDRLFMEAMVQNGRHVEVQIVADGQGHVVALGARDCSVQRRHQKVLEEAPPAGLSSELVAAIKQSAVQLAAKVGYQGVGTVEFLVQAPSYYFLEMNPRLQVEHGITESLTGTDLVELQIRIARGESLAALAQQTPPEQGFAIEARVCAEDPDAGFLPAPGRIARFDPALGPNVRVDTGVVAGSDVPPDFDSLIAKVIATGSTREQARARLACALRDFDLVIEGGATNKGYLLELLDDPDYRAGGVDTGWLDRWNEQRRSGQLHASEALVAAAVLSYQQGWRAERRSFFTDASTITPESTPSPAGREIDLSHNGDSYRLHVYSVGSWRYRVHLDGRAVGAQLVESGSHGARLVVGSQVYRVLHDMTESTIRVELEGHAFQLGRQTAGQVRAAAPSMVVSIHVRPGDSVEAGQPLGLLEAMKMEIGFSAPVSGVVSEVRAQKGQQLAVGDVIVVIEPAQDDAAASTRQRLSLPEQDDPLAVLFAPSEDQHLGRPDLISAQNAGAQQRQRAMRAVDEEVRRIVLGFDVNPQRLEKLIEFLEAPLPDGLSREFREELSTVRQQLGVFADLEQLFLRDRRIMRSGELSASNRARMHLYVRRIRAEGAGLPTEFLKLLRRALAHYGIRDLTYSDDLERAVLRMFASQLDPEPRRRLIMSVVRRLIALIGSGVELRDDSELHSALERVAAMRGTISNALADSVIEATYSVFQRPALAEQGERITQRLESWLAAAEKGHPSPPEEVLSELSLAPSWFFERISGWLREQDAWRRLVALGAYVRRFYAPRMPTSHVSELFGGRWVDRILFGDGPAVLGMLATAKDLGPAFGCLMRVAETDRVDALELVVTADDLAQRDQVFAQAEQLAKEQLKARRLTLSVLVPEHGPHHETFVREENDLHHLTLYGIHPETALRIGLDRYAGFAMQRIAATEDIYCFHGRSRKVRDDERMFVLADVRGRSTGPEIDEAGVGAAIENAFHDATRTLRINLGERDARRLLQWNRIVVSVARELPVAPKLAESVARRLLPSTRHLGLEKAIMRISARQEDGSLQDVELVISDSARGVELIWREPHTQPLMPATAYVRNVVSARRRGLVYPYELIDLLTRQTDDTGVPTNPDGEETAPLPAGSFEELDIDPKSDCPQAFGVAGRAPGQNQAGVVFGLMRTPTDKVPEGIRRVLIISDPTRDMGALSAAECNRIVAAIDLAEEERIPVEWVAVSSGARIAMDSGTENLDATARVVRRIVTFTQAGGTIHVIVAGVNVGAQSYWDALATMLMHTRGVLIMTPNASMVLTGRSALAASGSVSAEDEASIGGPERVMGPNGQAQYFAEDIMDAYSILYEHYDYSYVVPGERHPRPRPTRDALDRDVRDFPYPVSDDAGFKNVGEIFDPTSNPGRKRPFSMRALMRAVSDQDSSHLERWQSQVGAETAIVWDTHLGGHPVSLIGIESRNTPRWGYRPLDGPAEWNGGTLFPQSSKKVARALNAASGNRPAVILANLSGFDGSPESMRKLQLEYGAEIARAVVNFEGPLVFLVVSRYHGGAYVVFSRELNPQLRALAVEGSYASVIGGGPAATVVFPREVRARVAADPRIQPWRARLQGNPTAEERATFDQLRRDITLEKRAEVAAEFDAIHTVQRAMQVGSLEGIIAAEQIRPLLIQALTAE